MNAVMVNARRSEVRDSKFPHQGFYVTMEDNAGTLAKILTVSTSSDITANKWLQQVKKSIRNVADLLVVGVWGEKDPRSVAGSPIRHLYICSGSHCLTLSLPEPGKPASKFLRSFFDDKKVVAVGVGECLKETMAKERHVDMKNYFDLSQVASIRFHTLNLRETINDLARIVLRWEMDLPVPNGVDWFGEQAVFAPEKVASVTGDAYVCYRMAYERQDIVKTMLNHR